MCSLDFGSARGPQLSIVRSFIDRGLGTAGPPAGLEKASAGPDSCSGRAVRAVADSRFDSERCLCLDRGTIWRGGRPNSGSVWTMTCRARRHPQEDQTRHRSRWVATPGLDGTTPEREGEIEDSSMSVHLPALASTLGPDQQPADELRVPAPATSDRSCQSGLLIELAQRRVERSQLGLDLDHEQGTTVLVPGEEINRATLPVFGIGDFGRW